MYVSMCITQQVSWADLRLLFIYYPSYRRTLNMWYKSIYYIDYFGKNIYSYLTININVAFLLKEGNDIIQIINMYYCI